MRARAPGSRGGRRAGSGWSNLMSVGELVAGTQSLLFFTGFYVVMTLLMSGAVAANFHD